MRGSGLQKQFHGLLEKKVQGAKKAKGSESPKGSKSPKGSESLKKKKRGRKQT